MDWIKTTDKTPNISDEDILMYDGEKIRFGFYGYKSEYDKEDGIGFIDYASWNSDFGYEFFESDIKYWMYAPKPPLPLQTTN